MKNIPLNDIRIASPCPARWENMEGDERARFCGECRKHVYDLSSMTATAAAELVRAKEGNLCARFYRRADGTILHAEDCPVGVAARHWRRVKHCAGAAVSLVMLLLGVNKASAGDGSGNKGKPPVTPPAEGHTMGIVCPPPSPTPAPTPKPTPPPK